MHRQVIVKANVPVDEGVAALVVALCGFPQIIPFTSCQSAEDGRAQVAFSLLNAGEAEMVNFLANMSISIGAQDGELRVSLSLEWFAGGENGMAWIRIPAEQIAALVFALENITGNLNNGGAND